MALIVRSATRQIGSTFSDRIAEWLLASCMFNWGVILATNPDLYHIAEGVPFGGLARMAHQETWAWYCLIVGFIRLMALLINGWAVPSTYHIRSLTSFLSLPFWVTIGAGLLLAGRPTTGVTIFPLLPFVELWCLHRTGRDFGLHRALRDS